MFNRQKAIQNIEGLFPPDCEFPQTAAIGERLLNQAKQEAAYNWRDLPDNVLARFEQLCIAEDNRQARQPSSF